MAKKRWEDLVDTSGGTFQLEARPAEGDLLYFAKTGSLFEIKFVEFQNPFYQLGKIYVFRLQCELFQYSSEVLDTGNAGVDAIEDGNSLDSFLFQLKTEAGDLLLSETSDSIIKEEFATTKTNANTDNDDFLNFTDIVDFTEVNPFGEVG